jgi:hypothetical protein
MYRKMWAVASGDGGLKDVEEALWEASPLFFGLWCVRYRQREMEPFKQSLSRKLYELDVSADGLHHPT